MPYDQTYGDYFDRYIEFEDLNSIYAPQPSYSQTTKENDSWVNVTLTKTDQDGTKTQVSFIAKK